MSTYNHLEDYIKQINQKRNEQFYRSLQSEAIKKLVAPVIINKDGTFSTENKYFNQSVIIDGITIDYATTKKALLSLSDIGLECAYCMYRERTLEKYPPRTYIVRSKWCLKELKRRNIFEGDEE